MGQVSKTSTTNSAAGSAVGKAEGTDSAHSIGEQAKGLASEVATQAKDIASDVTSQAKDLVTTKVTRRREQSAIELSDLAQVLRNASEQMDTSLLAPIIDKAANQVERASEFVMDADLSDVVSSTESFARRQPVLFLGGMFTLGVVAGRFLKSSAGANRAGTPQLTQGKQTKLNQQDKRNQQNRQAQHENQNRSDNQTRKGGQAQQRLQGTQDNQGRPGHKAEHQP